MLGGRNYHVTVLKPFDCANGWDGAGCVSFPLDLPRSKVSKEEVGLVLAKPPSSAPSMDGKSQMRSILARSAASFCDMTAS